MRNKEILLNLASEVNKLLKRYVDLHNRRIKEGGTFSSLFRRVDFKGIYQESESLLRDFIKLHNKIVESVDFNLQERRFRGVLYYYFSTLFRCMISFHQLVQVQYLRSASKNSLSFSENQKLEGEYKEWINEYMKRGGELEEEYRKLEAVDDSFTEDKESVRKPLKVLSKEERAEEFLNALNSEVIKDGERIDNYSLFAVIGVSLNEEINILGERLNKHEFPLIYLIAERNPEIVQQAIKRFQMRPDRFDAIEKYLKESGKNHF